MFNVRYCTTWYDMLFNEYRSNEEQGYAYLPQPFFLSFLACAAVKLNSAKEWNGL